MATTPSSASGQAFFPSSQTTPDHASANAMLAARKQQLAHLQTLQRQQQQVLQQMSTRSGAPLSPNSHILASYADGRDDRFSASGLRSNPGSPGGSVVSIGRSASPRRPAFECDYDTNPTELYLAVQRKDWDAALERATAFPHEASTWVSRKESDGKLRWRLLPLHASIIFRAPERVISSLLFAFAQGAQCKDDQGMLPLHLAFRNGADEEAVHSLLMAYPQSLDIQDRKGRTPMVLAQQSTHFNKDVWIRALERGPAYYAVASAAQVSTPVGGFFPAMGSPLNSAMHIPGLGGVVSGADGERIHELEAELAKTQETSQVLVDHVNSLEAQLASRSDTERFLATKIANLDSQLKEMSVKVEESAAEIEAKKEELDTKDDEKDELAKQYEEDIDELKVALADKKQAELKSYKLTNKDRYDLEERVEISERDCASAQANAAVLEAQLKKKIETEQSLASQVSQLASQLASSASSSSEATGAYQRKCEALTAENKKLLAHIEELEGKLGIVATALDAMAAEQERIVDAATNHEKTMAACAATNATIVADTTRQETLLEDAAKEREQIVSILMRQAEDAEKTMADREKVLESVKAQESDIVVAAQERDAVIESVSKQREYMDFMLNGELNFLKKTHSEEQKALIIEEKTEAMESKKNEFLNKTEGAAETSEDDEALDNAAEAIIEKVKGSSKEEDVGHIGDVNSEGEVKDTEAEEVADEADIDEAISAASSGEDEE